VINILVRNSIWWK